MTGNLQPCLIYHVAQGHPGAADPEYLTSLGTPGPVGCGMGLVLC